VKIRQAVNAGTAGRLRRERSGRAQQIPLGSGSVKVQGSGIPAGHKVWVAGREVPVDPKGNFIAEEVLPNGTQNSRKSRVLDGDGNGSLYLRDLEFKRRGPVLCRYCRYDDFEEQCERSGKNYSRVIMLRSPLIRRWMAGWRST